MALPGRFEEEALAALQRAVSRALDRKRRLGQYAVFWQDGRVVFDGPDAPVEEMHSAPRGRIGAGEAGGPAAGADPDPGPEPGGRKP